jgi:hypothetical protein
LDEADRPLALTPLPSQKTDKPRLEPDKRPRPNSNCQREKKRKKNVIHCEREQAQNHERRNDDFHDG